MSAENWNVILVVLTVLVAAYAVYLQTKKGEAITVTGVATTLEESIPLSKEVIDVAQIVVNEIEGMRRKPDHQISNEEAFNRALNIVKGWSPALSAVENKKIITAINSAVLVASALSHQILADKSVSSGQVEN